MGTLSQLFWYVLRDKHPTKLEQAHIFSHITVTEGLKKFRRGWRKEQGLSGKKSSADSGQAQNHSTDIP